MKIYSLIVLLVLITASCNKATFSDSDRVIARVYDEYLYFSDVRNLVPPSTTPSDSLAMTQNYISNWIKTQLLVYQAEKNLTQKQKDFTRQLEDYRNSLIIFNYESEFIRQNLDTVVSAEEIENYYNKYPSNFTLNDNIVQVVYAMVHEDSPYRNKIKTLVNSEFESDRDSLEFYCIRYALDYGLIDREWITFDDFLQKTAISVENPEGFLLNQKLIEDYESPEWFYAQILNFGLKDSISPLSLETANISSIILNKRKKQLIKEMHENVYEQAIEENDFEFY
ncbi:MAG: hypothetical protein K9H16_02550 [Bacteroidales bacterium]|nr:hypothetical protein [Bacteroidales bacterium]